MLKNLLVGIVLFLLVGILMLTLSRRSDPQAPAIGSNDADSRASLAGDEPATLVELASLNSTASGRAAAPQARGEAWVLVLEGGVPTDLEAAECTATLLADSMGAQVMLDTPPTLSGVGDMRWEAPLAGTWELAVKIRGVEKARRQVLIRAQKVTRTVVNLDALITIEGLVRNVFGAPCPSYFVGFVPDGGSAPTSPREWLDLPHTRCDSRGKFSMQLPHAGTYRAFAGYGGRVLVEDRDARKLLDTPSRFMTLTVPVPTHLTIRAQELGGGILPTSYTVSVYRRKEIMDMIKPIPSMPKDRPDVDPNDPSLDDDEREELLTSIEFKKMDQALDFAALKRRRSVVPKGWRVDRSGALGAAGTLTLTGLPEGEELRFAASRDGEPFHVSGAGAVDPLLPTEMILTFPAPLPEGTAAPAKARSVSVTTRLGEGQQVVAQPGVAWR